MKMLFVTILLFAIGSSGLMIQPVGAQPRADDGFGPVPSFPDEQPPALRPVREAGPAPMGDPADVGEAPQGKDCFRLHLEDGSLIVGQFPDDAKLKLKSKIGELEIALHQVGRIEHSLQDDQFQVTLANGDRLTGELILNKLSLQAAWGAVPLQVESLFALEAGKLHEQKIPITRRSADGRTMVTVMQKRSRFQPSMGDPEAHSTSPGTTYRVPRSVTAPPTPAFSPLVPDDAPRGVRRVPTR